MVNKVVQQNVSQIKIPFQDICRWQITYAEAQVAEQKDRALQLTYTYGTVNRSRFKFTTDLFIS